MALIKSGEFAEFSLAPRVAVAGVAQQGVDSFSTLSEATREAPFDNLGFAKTDEPRGLTLKKLHMGPKFQSFIARIFDLTSEVYFLAWAWDLSGAKVQGESPIYLYPGTVSPVDGTLIPMKGSEEREFLGSGVLLYPARRVTAGISLRLQLWESHSKERKFGETLQKVTSSIQKSQLNQVLTLVAGIGGVTTGTVALVEQAGLELVSVIGEVLKATSDDYVDYYEGYFPASVPWEPEEQSWSGHASEIVLSRIE
ncbi:MAG TPA: hypothetical protein VKC63_03090 [Solirubrobacterales bacterium]|nr:hypothetical protein [Solirubrobacterales bacterium]